MCIVITMCVLVCTYVLCYIVHNKKYKKLILVNENMQQMSSCDKLSG